MPREVLEFRVVVASPSDVFETRKVVFDVIHELNRAFEIQRISIRGLGWEEYATPGIGSDAQDVISEQLLREYDMLIALFGTKLGTPTNAAASGTVEEIEHAIANTNSPLGKHRVQVYFLDKIDGISSISLDEFKSVADYRKNLEPRGILYRLFKSDDELQQEIRVNIQRPILEYLHKNGNNLAVQSSSPIERPAAPAIRDPVVSEEEIGLLDQQEKAEEAIQAAAQAIDRVNVLIREIGAEVDKQVAEIEELSFFGLSAKEKKKIINDFASFLKSKANNLKQEAQIGRESFSRYSSALIVLAGMQREGGDLDRYKAELAQVLGVAETMLSSLPENRRAISGFKTAIENLPRITIQFNQSKKMLIDALDECQQLFDQTERSIYEIADKT